MARRLGPLGKVGVEIALQHVEQRHQPFDRTTEAELRLCPDQRGGQERLAVDRAHVAGGHQHFACQHGRRLEPAHLEQRAGHVETLRRLPVGRQAERGAHPQHLGEGGDGSAALAEVDREDGDTLQRREALLVDGAEEGARPRVGLLGERKGLARRIVEKGDLGCEVERCIDLVGAPCLGLRRLGRAHRAFVVARVERGKAVVDGRCGGRRRDDGERAGDEGRPQQPRAPDGARRAPHGAIRPTTRATSSGGGAPSKTRASTSATSSASAAPAWWSVASRPISTVSRHSPGT